MSFETYTLVDACPLEVRDDVVDRREPARADFFGPELPNAKRRLPYVLSACDARTRLDKRPPRPRSSFAWNAHVPKQMRTPSLVSSRSVCAVRPARCRTSVPR